jgi:hypothetical protein|tara:strand:- start:3424 stop:3639 length:216 start_codon:yes stop_codon:yes gene_type:complete
MTKITYEEYGDTKTEDLDMYGDIILSQNCCLCGKKFKDKYDRNNAEPLQSADCCSSCNDEKVIPARLGGIK